MHGMSSLDRVKVLVLGDSGVGKSSLVHLLCQNQVLGNPSWTVGCSVDVRIHEYKEGTPEEKTYYTELWDIGGSVGSASSVKSTRAVFYNYVNGIILVHDLTNKKSSQNLYRWSLEALNRDLPPTGVLVTNGDYDREQFADNQIPLLVIGTKLDQIPEQKRNDVLSRTAFLAEDFNAEEINLDCTNMRYLAAGSSNAVKLSRFFDKYLEMSCAVDEIRKLSDYLQTSSRTVATELLHPMVRPQQLPQKTEDHYSGQRMIFNYCRLPQLPVARNENLRIEGGAISVIEKRYFSRDSTQIPGFPDRKRLGSGMPKNFHYD